MNNKDPIVLIGSPPSPYTRKMIALLRFKQIPYKVIWGDPVQLLTSGDLANLNIDPPKPSLLPTFILENESNELSAFTDSTPLIRRFEKEYPSRNCIPINPVLSFLNYVLEDFADEWVTKYMFHYRWHFDEDIDNAGTLLPLNQVVNLDSKSLSSFKEHIAQRQIGRLGVVGSSDVTAAAIERSYERFLNLLEEHFSQFPFLLGNRPASCDFALYGQLSQLVGFDPTSRKIAHKVSPRTVAWTNIMEDLSGLEVSDEDWIDEDSELRSNGKEDFEYLSLEPPYRASNSLLSDVSEAALFLDAESFRVLRPYLVSIPSPSSLLNVNTHSL